MDLLGTIGRFFSSSLQAEKAPYVFTLFIAALGWTALRTSDRLQQTAFVEFRTRLIAPSSTSTQKFATVRLRNVTNSQTFDCFILEQFTPGKFGAANDQMIQYRGTVAANATLAKNTSNNWQWIVKDFMPGADLELGAALTGNEKWNVLVRPCEERIMLGDAKEDERKDHPRAKAPILLERSLLTWYVERELIVLWSGLAIWLFMLIGLNAIRSKSIQSRRLEFKRRSRKGLQ